MDRPAYDVFISYRREGGAHLARLILAHLERHGLRDRVFLDVDDMPVGPFPQAIRETIGNARFVVVILSHGCLDRCQQADDWFRREIAHALATGRTVLPLHVTGFRFETEQPLPADVAPLARLDSIEYSHNYSEASLNKLLTRLKPPRPWSRWLLAAGAALLVATLLVLYWLFGGSRPGTTAYENAILSPHFECSEALELAKSAYANELSNHDLVDVVGSYYICLHQADATIFHRFPEWLFLFRHRQAHTLSALKVTDSRIPKIPNVDVADRQLKHGWVAYFCVAKRPKMEFKLNLLDEEGKIHSQFAGSAPEDRLDEVIEGVGVTVLARRQVYGGGVEDVRNLRVIEGNDRLGSVEIRHAIVPANPFHSSLHPLEGWRVGVGAAIQQARARGATGSPPDKDGKGGSSVVRLFNGPQAGGRGEPLNGPYWQVPYRVGLRPILVDARNGSVLAVNDQGQYSSTW